MRRLRCIPNPQRFPSENRRGYVLLAVLIVIVVLSLSAYHFTEAMTAEFNAAQRATQAQQARVYALSGLHYAAAVLTDLDAYFNRLGGNPFDNPDAFNNVVVYPGNSPRNEGRFAIISVINEGDSTSPTYQTRFGVIDEGGKININAFIQFDSSGQRLYDALIQLPTLKDRTDLVDAIVDWVDADDNTRPSGAEAAEYSDLGYRPKNGPLNSLDELLLVKGMTVTLLYGNDRNRNGLPDDGAEGAPVDRGLSEYLTVWGRELNTNSLGEPRVYVNGSEDLQLLYEDLILAVGQEMADYIMAYRLYGGSAVTTSSSGNRTSSRLPSQRNYHLTQRGPGGGAGPMGGSGGFPAGGIGGRGSGGLEGSRGSIGSGSGPNGSIGGLGDRGNGNFGGRGGQNSGYGDRGGFSNRPNNSPNGGANSSRGNSSTPGSAGSSGSPNPTSPKTVLGTPQDLQAAVQQSLADPNVRPRTRLRSIVQLIDTQVTLPKPKDAPANTPTVIVPSPLNDPGKRDQYLPILLDQLSTQGSFELAPRININTAPREVLMTLTTLSQRSSSSRTRSGGTSSGGSNSPSSSAGTTGDSSSGSSSNSGRTSSDSLTEGDIDAILSARQGLPPTDPALQSTAWLINLAGISPSKFQRVERYITTRSSVYRVQAIGYFGEGGPVARLEAVIDTNQGAPRFLAFRDLTDIDTPRGFEPQR